MATEDLTNLSDDELAKLAYGDDEGDTEPTGTETSSDPQAPAADPPPAQDPAPAAEPAPQGEPGNDQQQPKDRGDLTVALRQAREQERLYRDTLQNPQALAQHLAQMGYQVMPVQQQQQQAQEYDLLDPEVAQFTQAKIEGVRGELGEQILSVKLEMGREFARQSLPDYDQTINGLLAQMNDPLMGPIIQAAEQQYANHPNPALAFYQLGKRLSASPQVTEEAVQAKAKEMADKMVAEALSKQQQPLDGPKGLARAGSVTPGIDKAVPIRKLSTDELERRARGED